jgi:hypothetical protein
MSKATTEPWDEYSTRVALDLMPKRALIDRCIAVYRMLDSERALNESLTKALRKQPKPAHQDKP